MGLFEPYKFIPDLWETNATYFQAFGTLADKSAKGSARKKVLASSQLIANILHLGTYAKGHIDHEPEQALNALLQQCFPHNLIFTGLWSPATLLHTCDYCMDKAFARAVILVSKTLGAANFPNGVYGKWPPEPPAELLTTGFQPT